MVWFRKHLNWTMILAWIAALAIFLASIPLYVESENGYVFALSLLGFYYLVIIITSAWVLRQKGQSLWYLWLFFLREFYVIIVCGLQNRQETVTSGDQPIRAGPASEVSGVSQAAIEQPYETLMQETCPRCGKNLFYYPSSRIFRCKYCDVAYTFGDIESARSTLGYEASAESRRTYERTQQEILDDLDRRRRQVGQKATELESGSVLSSRSKTVERDNGLQLIAGQMPAWLKASLAVFISCALGLTLGALAGTTIPFWVMLGVSSVYSVEKWYSYFSAKQKALGTVYRLILNLGILSLLGLLVWSCVRLFSHQLVPSPLAGSLVVVAELVAFVWTCGVVSKNSWRWPSMKLTVLCLVVLFLILAFAGVEPLSSYKDGALSFVTP